LLPDPNEIRPDAAVTTLNCSVASWSTYRTGIDAATDPSGFITRRFRTMYSLCAFAFVIVDVPDTFAKCGALFDHCCPTNSPPAAVPLIVTSATLGVPTNVPNRSFMSPATVLLVNACGFPTNVFQTTTSPTSLAMNAPVPRNLQ